MEEDGDKLKERLRKQGWYLGEVTEEAASSVLRSARNANVFVVYSKPDGAGLTLSARFKVDGVDEGIIEHLQISASDDGTYQLAGQTESSDDVITAVNSYVTVRDPPLAPALGKSFETQLSIPEDPPSYSQAHRALAPDIAPLPDIAEVKVEPAKEAKAGDLSPSNSLGRLRSGSLEDSYSGHGTRPSPAYMRNPHWYRYKNHCCLHPKNCWHCCCYRDTYWTGSRERYNHKWYSLKGTGPLRLLLLLLFWALCGSCIGCVMLCGYCCIVCIYLCCDIDDDD